MSKTLDEIRKKLQALEVPRGGRGAGTGSKLVYPHWDIAEGTSAILRFLPDKNPDNVFFWVEKQIIKIPFDGILGHDEHKPVVVEVPCIEMWDGKNTCPILKEVRPMWKDKSLEETARKYWIKKTYYAQGFVEADPTGEEAPENPIRKFSITPQIFTIIKAALLDPDMDNSPVDYINGTNFVVSKTSKGGYADYSTSKWARKESSLTQDQLDAIEQYGLVDLNTYLPKRPTDEGLAAMFDMFEASLAGELYDPSKWAKFYKPWGFDAATNDGDSDNTPAPRVSVPVSKPVVKQVSAPVVQEDAEEDPPFEADETPAPATVTAGGAAKSPQEILAMLRNRTAK